MSIETWINVTISAGTAATAYFTYRSAKHASKSVQNATRPILVITPGNANLDFIHKPQITVKNFGNGPAIIDEILFFGTELTNISPEKMQLIKTLDPQKLHPKDIIGPSLEVEFTSHNNWGMNFGETDGVSFILKYRDYVGNFYTATCEWNTGRKQWDRYGN